MKNESGIKKSKKMTMWKVKMIREKKKKKRAIQNIPNDGAQSKVRYKMLMRKHEMKFGEWV